MNPTKQTRFPIRPILIVDDEEQFLYSINLSFRSSGITNVQTCLTGKQAERLITEMDFSVIILDINLPDIRGTELLDLVIERHPETPVLMITAVNEAHVAVECIKKGAMDYLVKPFDSDKMLASVRNAISQKELHGENEALKGYLLGNELKKPDAFNGIVTGNRRMHSLFQYIEAISSTPFPVLITGETGVGKELIAQAIHVLSERKGNFVPVNVGGIDDNTFSDTLFGHIKGAFTGADVSRPGLIERAAGGTLFLDEIGDLSKSSQVKLLRVLQNRDYLPLGSDVAKLADVRLIVATNKSIGELNDPTLFRSDLFHRLRTHHIAIPPLRERIDDLSLLVDHFVKEASVVLVKETPGVPRGLIPLLSTYRFPGNVRELRSMVFDAMSILKSNQLPMNTFEERLGITGLPEATGSDTYRCIDQAPIQFGVCLPTIQETVQMLINEALSRSNNNQNTAARMLGISPQALSRRLKYASKKEHPYE
jgi:DNA-binding NtrC family response regulator